MTTQLKRAGILSLLGALLNLSLPFVALAQTTLPALASVGQFDSWKLTGVDKLTAVSSHDGDTSFIASNTFGERQTYVFSGSNVPTGSTIASVTLTAIARRTTSSGVNMQLIAAKGTDASEIVAFTPSNLTTSYVAKSWTLTTNPFTGAAWTASEVNDWKNSVDGKTIEFGVRHNQPEIRTARVTQLSLTISYTEPEPTPDPEPIPGCDGPAPSIFADDFATGTLAAWTTAQAAWSTQEFEPSNFAAKLSGVTLPQATRGRLVKKISTVGFKDIRVSFDYQGTGFEGDDELAADWFDGKTWRYLSESPRPLGSQFCDGCAHNLTTSGWKHVEFVLPSAATNNSYFMLEVRANFDDATDSFLMDNLILSGRPIACPA